MPRGHEVFDAGFGVSVEDGAEGVGEIVDGVHTCHLADGDKRGEHAPVLGADLVAGEEGVFAGQRDRTDLVFGRVGVELEGSVVEEADQAWPVRKGIADILGQRGFLRDARQLRFQLGLSAAMIGAECSRRAARRLLGSCPRTVFSIRYSNAIWRNISSAMGEPSLSKRFTKRRRTWVQKLTSCHGPSSRVISVSAL